MPKKTAKHKSTREQTLSVEIEARREAQQLRRLRNLQQSVTRLSRELTRAVRRADGARLGAARELCADTGWTVADLAELEGDRTLIQNMRGQLTEAVEASDRDRRLIDALQKQVEQLQTELRAARVAAKIEVPV